MASSLLPAGRQERAGVAEFTPCHDTPRNDDVYVVYWVLFSMYVRKRDTLLIYWRQARRHKLLIGVMFVALGVGTLLDLARPLFYRQFFNLLAGEVAPVGPIATALTSVIITVFALNASSWLLHRSSRLMVDYFQPRVMSGLMQDAYDYLQRHSYGFFANNFVGSLVRRITKLPRAFEQMADSLYWSLFPLAITIAGVFIVLFRTNRTIALIMAGWATLFMIINYSFARWRWKYVIIRSLKDTETVGILADALTNNVNIQLFNGFGFEFARVKKVTEELRRLRTWTWNTNTILDGIQAGLVVVIEFLLMYFGIQLWQKGLLTLGDFVLIQAYLITLLNQLWGFGRTVRDIYESFADAEDMTLNLILPHEIKDAPGAKPLAVTRGAIDFQNVSFNYAQTRAVLKDFSLTIAPREKIALVGPSGAGKTTIVKLLFRFYDVEGGKILIDNERIHRVTLASLRDALSLVPQEPIIFHRSIRENIRYGKRDASEADVERAAALAHCDEFIGNLPKQWDTLVGERGIKLSGGERQRVAIARAILKNAPILVLDEATSSLDSRSEALIQDALKTLMKDKTVIVIAHRLSTIRLMDRIVVVDHGEVIDQGTHEELTSRPTLYRDLWQLQAGGFLPTTP